MRTIVLLLAAFLSCLPSARAWNATGHMMTADLAFNELDAAQRAHIGAIIRAHPRFAEDFAAAMPGKLRRTGADEQTRWLLRRASIWPDLVPQISDDVRAAYHRGTWHYINLPVFLTAADAATLSGKLDHNMATRYEPPLRPGLNVIQALEGNLRVWHDPTARDADKALALCWILHLVGDLHQPLHTVALFSDKYFPAGDRGGNSIRVTRDPEPGNLHAVWDDLPDSFVDLGPAERTESMLGLENVTQDSPAEWVTLHARLARQFVYTPALKAQLINGLADDPGMTVTLSPDYLEAAGALAKEQVIAAGQRIAALLTLPPGGR